MKMKKILIVIGSAFMGIASISAREAGNPVMSYVTDGGDATVSQSIMYRPGYRAGLELSCGIGEVWGLSTSHGYSFGNGLYVGGGAGFGAETAANDDGKPGFVVPVFADLKYDFIDQTATPAVGVRAGEVLAITGPAARWFVNPYVGVDISRFSISVGYELQQIFAGEGLGGFVQYAKISVGIIF